MTTGPGNFWSVSYFNHAAHEQTRILLALLDDDATEELRLLMETLYEDLAEVREFAGVLTRCADDLHQRMAGIAVALTERGAKSTDEGAGA